MLDFASARARLIEAARPIERCTRLPVEDGLGRILAADARALSDSPPADVSTLDGYAIATRDLAPEGMTRLHVAQRIAAGQTGRLLQPGEAARIFTGAALPPGADAILAQEAVQREGEDILFNAHPAPFEDVRRRGADFHAGELLAAGGTRLGPAHLGLLASAGIATLEVRERLRLALLTTGDEVIPPGRPLRPGQIYDGNGPMLRGLLQGLGCEIIRQAHLGDDPQATRAALREAAAEADVILSCGGVSVGEEDHVKAAVEALGRIDLWQVRMRPGKPLAFGQVGDTPFIGLPGNPISAFVTFLLLARPYLLARMGAQVPPLRPLRLPAGFARPAAPRREFARGWITAEQRIELFADQGSGILSALARAEVLVEIPEHTAITPGDPVSVYLLAELLA